MCELRLSLKFLEFKQILHTHRHSTSVICHSSLYVTKFMDTLFIKILQNMFETACIHKLRTHTLIDIIMKSDIIHHDQAILNINLCSYMMS